MQTLSSDALFALAIQLELPELLQFCSTSKKINDNVCKKDNIWYYKLNTEFPNWRELKADKIIKNPKTLESITEMKTAKDTYLLLYWYNIFRILKEKLKIREDIYKIYFIKELYLTGNRRMKIIPPEIEQLSKLQELYLDNNAITVIPPEIGKLSKLQQLYLSNNEIKVIPPEIGQLSNLQGLSLSNNAITVIPPEIGQLSNLQGLYLSDNEITVIPPEMGKLSNLQVLYLYNNKITAIPPEIGKLSKLQQLYLSNNEIKVIPPEIGNLSNLRSLYLSNNAIKEIKTLKEMLKEKLPNLNIYT